VALRQKSSQGNIHFMPTGSITIALHHHGSRLRHARNSILPPYFLKRQPFFEELLINCLCGRIAASDMPRGASQDIQ